MPVNSLSDDIDYLKTMAQRGGVAPQLGGRMALWWGGLVVVALLAHWGALTGALPLAPEYIGLIWMIFGIVGGIGAALIGRTLKGKPGAGAVNNRVASIVWTADALIIFLYAISVAIAVIAADAPLILFDTIMPLAFAAYAVAHYTIGRISGHRWEIALAGVSAIGVLITMVLVGRPEAYLAAAVFVVLTSIIPGILQMRAEPKAA